jgi:hypothetical protein
MIGRYETRMERSNPAWQAMVWGASQPDPMAEFGEDAWVCEKCDAWTAPGHLVCALCESEAPKPTCDTCDDTGTVPVFGPLGATYYPPCPECRGPASED